MRGRFTVSVKGSTARGVWKRSEQEKNVVDKTRLVDWTSAGRRRETSKRGRWKEWTKESTRERTKRGPKTERAMLVQDLQNRIILE